MFSTKTDHKLNFELYLEGVKIPFSSITLNEQEDNIPQMSVSFVGIPGALRILPGTIVQLFGPAGKKHALLFEGEMVSRQYSKGSSGRVVGISCMGILSMAYRSHYRPSDSIATAVERAQQGTTQKLTLVPIVLDNVGGPRTTENAELKEQPTQESADQSKAGSPMTTFGISTKLQEWQKNKPDEVTKGNIHSMYESVIDDFEDADIYYKTCSRSLKLSDSVFCFPNPNKLKPTLMKALFNTWDALKNYTMSNKGTFNFIDGILKQFQKYLYYTSISPAAYTSTSRIEHVTEGIRMYILPDMSNSPPANCNIFFPEQIIEYGEGRNFLSEPTRTILRSQFRWANADVNNMFSPTYVAPNTAIYTTEKGVMLSKFTDEETYRGIILHETDISDEYVQALRDKDNKDFTEDDKQIFKDQAMHTFLSDKFKTRSLSLLAEWSPYRMIGLPALILEIGGPSLFGIITSINTTISANGTAQSQISLRNPRLIFDEDFEKSIFNPGNEEYEFGNKVMNDLSSDGMLNFNKHLYSEDLYGFFNIGKDVYTFLLDGEFTEGGPLLKNISNWTWFENKNSDKDRSILWFLKEIPERVKNEPDEIYYTRILYHAIKKVKENYSLKISDMYHMAEYANAINYRNLLTKEDYLEFIGGLNDGTMFDCKDGLTMFKFARDIEVGSVKTYDNTEVLGIQAELDALVKPSNEISISLQEAAADKTDVTTTGGFKYYVTPKKKKMDTFFNQKMDEYNKKKKILEDKLEKAKEKANIPSVKNTTVSDVIEYTTDPKNFSLPYNLTRRLHVLHGFKNYLIDIEIHNSVTTVVK